ncbi:hypothetical protein CC80DRAFT_506160 [Byssothecium circinans]|uniref:RING-type domain-containing protein n=1 Tax=Byssothecium circinans TaxID=147558 RepID=A0A6A5TNM3_9PLEO|nr:hypothetical protein CC80DRAFT_506160 [Byssothecium circinans]
MSAQSLSIWTIDFPDPGIDPDSSGQFTRLPANESFAYQIQGNIQTLSSKKTERGNAPFGLLYVPDLASDACKEAEQTYIPSNVTRLTDLPSAAHKYGLVAFAPWFNASCMIQYFEAARQAHLKAFVVYQPGKGNALPPVMNDASWLLNDGGSWMTANQFPTYAISSSAGGLVSERLGLYSGNTTSLPNADAILRWDPSFRTTDYVRLWVTVDINVGNSLPSLWVFLLIVLGLLILAFSGTSLAMHCVQRRRRNSLRSRVINGEVDLESLGVSRLSVPRDYLEKLPLYTYSARPERDAPTQADNIPSPAIETGPNLSRSSTYISAWQQNTALASAPNAVPAHASGTFSQATCSICLDDFEPNESQVRELPCQHIYHADCIDTFLVSNSSLCPLCKQSVLPAGYCPTVITNVMVRRERIIRRTRARAANANTTSVQPVPTPGAPPGSSAPSRPARAFGSLGGRVGGALNGRRIFSAPERSQPRPAADIEMAATPQQPNTMPENTPAPERPANECNEPPATQNRREWARQRAMALLGNRDVPSAAEEDTAPAWRRSLRKIFPGFR